MVPTVLDADTSLARIALAAGVLLLAPLAGCLEPIGEATQDAIGGEVTDGQVAEPADELSEAEIQSAYSSAFDAIEPGDDEVQRVSVDMAVDPLERDESYELALFWDNEERVSVLSLENATTDVDGAGEIDGLIVGTVDRTTFFGVPPDLATYYDEDAEWEQDPFNTSGANTSHGSMADLVDPEQTIEEIDELPEGAEIDWSSTTFEGREAHDVRIEHANGEDEMDVRVVIDASTERPLLVEGTVVDEAEFDGPAEIAITFAYGEQASHEHEGTITRLEAMALDGGGEAMFGTTGETQTLTVQPSRNAGSIALEDVEVHARSSQGSLPDGEVTTEMRLPAEDGQLLAEDGDLVYDDKDGDGTVSPGDEVRFTPHTEQAREWSVSLYDEETGMHVTPGPGTLAALLAGLAGLAASRKRRR